MNFFSLILYSLNIKNPFSSMLLGYSSSALGDTAAAAPVLYRCLCWWVGSSDWDYFDKIR